MPLKRLVDYLQHNILYTYEIIKLSIFSKIENNETIRSGMNGVNDTENKIDNTAELWVQKYKPNKYLDLLSDESTNRMLLHWLKLWDKVVFNKEVYKKKKNTTDSYEKSTGICF